MVLATIASATAFTTNLTDTYYTVKKLEPDLVVMPGIYSNEDYLLYYSSSGMEKMIDVSPYNPINILREAVQPSEGSLFYAEEDLYFLDLDTEQIVWIDYSAETLNYQNISGYLPTIYFDRARLTGIVKGGAASIDAIISYQSTYGYNPYTWVIEDLGGTMTTTSGGAYGCTTNPGAWGSTCTPQYYCGDTFSDYNSTTGTTTIYSPVYSYCGTSTPNIQIRSFTWNQTSIATAGSGYDSSFGAYGGEAPQTGFFCYDDETSLTCCEGSNNGCKYFVKNNLSFGATSLNTINVGGTNIYPRMLDSNGYDTIYVDENKTLGYYYGGTLTNVSIPVFRASQFSQRVLSGAVIYFLSGSFGVLATFDELTNITGTNITSGETYNNATTIETYNLTDTTTIELMGNNLSIIGRDQELLLYDYNDPGNILLSDSVSIGEDIYKTSKSTNNIMAGTSDGIYTYDLSTLTEQYHDKWGFLHADRAYSVATLSDTTAWVCDNHNEPDYYSAGNDPTGNLGTGCHDLQIDLSELYLLVDSEEYGIISIDISNSTNPTIDDNLDLITERYDQDYGDLTDYLDDADQDLLLTITGYLTFTSIDTSDKHSLEEGTTCNSAGAGYITSVEYLDQYNAIAGTHNGRILFCDLSNPDEETNTEWYSIEGLDGEAVTGLEYDGQFIHAISENHYVIMTYEVEEVETNNPPYIDSYSVSDYNPDIGQDVVIDITPGGVEPVDVIKYGVKCNGTEAEYTTNLIGSFTCNYASAGTYYASIAITDNYHYPDFYDERILQIIVTEENFTGGILTVEVSDPINDAYVVGAQVEADNQSTNTNDFGRATITTTEPISYAVTITKTGYQTKVVSLEANGDVHYVQLIPTATENQSALSITVTDDANNPIEGALVSYTHTTTFDYDYTWTDSQGRAYFLSIDPGTVSLQASATNYDDVQQYVTIPVTGTTSVTIVLPLLSEAYLGSLHADRDCIDNGIWLCGADNIVTHSCTQDSDCLSDYCTPGINRCSRFNYSVCDEAEMARDQRCVAKFTAEGGLGGITNFMLTNLLWVIIILILLIAIGLVFMSWNK